MEKVFPLFIQKYETFTADNSASLTNKINSIVQALNQLGKISNDVVHDWNKVMEWAMGEGLDESTNKGIDNLVNSGRFDELIQLALTDFNEQVNEIRLNLKKYDVFSDSNKIVLDGTKLSNLLNANGGKTFYLPDGNYSLNSTINITSNACLELSANAVIKANVIMTDMVNYNRSTTDFGVNRFIRGGVWDGNGLASRVFNFVMGVMITLEDMVIKNPVNRGVYIQGGYGFLLRNVYLNNTLTTNVSDNIAIEMKTSDSIFRDIVTVNFTVGMKLTSGGNYVNGFHPWGTQTGRLDQSIGIDNYAQGNYFHNIYFDTCAICFQTDHRADLHQCNFLVPQGYFTVTPTFIKNNVADFVTVNQCYFEYKTSIGDTIPVATGTNTKFIVYNDCDFASPTSLTGIPVTNRRNKYFKIQITTQNWSSIPANGYTEKDITITDVNTYIDIRDSIIFNTFGYFEQGIVPTISMKDNNIVKVRLNNITASPITPANRNIYLTIIQKANGDKLDYTTPTVTGN